MKTHKLPLVALVAMTVATLNACGDDSKDKDLNPSSVPSAVASAFLAQYPTATNVEWESNGKYYKADFQTKGGLVEADAWYTSTGSWAMTQLDYGRNIMYLPNEVTTVFAQSEYGAWQIDDADEYQYPDAARNIYVIEVETKGQPDTDLYYRMVGGKAVFVGAAAHRDATVTPDTKLP